MAAMAYAEFVVSVSRLLVLLMTSYPFASRLGFHNTDCNSHLVCSIDPNNIGCIESFGSVLACLDCL